MVRAVLEQGFKFSVHCILVSCSVGVFTVTYLAITVYVYSFWDSGVYVGGGIMSDSPDAKLNGFRLTVSFFRSDKIVMCSLSNN